MRNLRVSFLTILGVVLFSICGFGQDEDLEINSVKFEEYLCSISKLNTNEDTKIQVSEAEAYTGNLNIYGSVYEFNSSNFDWLYSFKKITSLSLSGIKNMTEIEINSNTFPKLTSLIIEDITMTEFNASKFYDLTDLSLYNTGLENIYGLEDCKNLENLRLNNNKLSNIDISQNTDLNSLQLVNNSFSELDLSKNSSLYINVENNNLTSLTINTDNILPGRDDILLINNNTNLSCVSVTNVENAKEMFTASYPDITFTTDCDAGPGIIKDDTFRAYLVGLESGGVKTVDLNGDGLIQEEEANAYKGEIEISSGVSDITGLKSFTSASSLSLGIFNSPDFSTLDLSGMSGLKTIEFNSTGSNAPGSTKRLAGNDNITSLNVSGCSALESINLEYTIVEEVIFQGSYSNLTNLNLWGNITSIDVSSLTSLTYLKAWGSFETINVSSLNKLTSLSLLSDGLKSIDLSKIPQLESLTIVGSDPSLTSLDVSNMPNLTFFKISSLDTPYRPGKSIFIEEVNLLNCPKLEKIYKMGATSVQCISVDLDKIGNIEQPTFQGPTEIDPDYRLTAYPCDALTVYIPDPYFKPYLLGVADSDGDGEIQVTEAEEYNGEIDIPITVKDLTGLKSFTAITSISMEEVANALFSDLDLIGMSSIKTIELYALGGIQKVDLTGCSSLESIYTYADEIIFNGSYALLSNISLECKGLDMSNAYSLSNLIDIFIMGDISYLDIKNCANLESFNIQGSAQSLTSLDLSNMTSLKYLYITNVDGFEVKNIYIKEVNLSGCSNLEKILTTKPLECLILDADKVKAYNQGAFDIRHSDANTELNIDYKVTTNCSDPIIHFTKKELEDYILTLSDINTIDDGVLTKSEVENFTGHIGLSGNPIEDINEIAEKIPNITSLYLADVDASTVDLTVFSNLQKLEILEKSENSTLEDLNLVGLPLIDIKIDAPNLTALDLYDVHLGNLTTLDVKSPKLICIRVNDVENATNKFGSSVGNAVFTENCSDLPVVTFEGPYFKDFLIEEFGIDINGDGKVQIIEAERVTSITMGVSKMVSENEASISNIIGIKSFANLTDFSCSNLPENLKEMDLSGMTNLTSFSVSTEYQRSLDVINLSGCTNLYHLGIGTSGTEETSLNIENCNSLYEIFLNYGKSIYTLDVSNLQSLATIDAMSSNLQNIVFRPNSSLQRLNCPNNQLTSLDLLNQSNLQSLNVLGNPELYCVQISDELYSSIENNIQADESTVFTTDCATEAAITINDEDLKDILLANSEINKYHPEFISFSEAQNFTGILEIISTDKNIDDLTGLEQFTQITGLVLDGIQATELNTSTNNLIASLQVSNSAFETINTGENENLVSIEITDAENVNRIDLSENENLTNISLEGVNALADINLESNKELTNLTIKECALKALDLSANTALTELTLNAPELQFLNLKDGNSEDVFLTFDLGEIDNLICATVDDPEYVIAEFQNSYPSVMFSDDCSSLTAIIIEDDTFRDYLVENFAFKTNANGDIFQSEADEFTGDMEITDPAIESLEGIKNFTGLQNLTITSGGENLTTLDVSDMSNLETLTVSTSKISTISTAGCSALTSMTLTNAGVSELTLNEEITSLSIEEETLTSLDLSGNTAITELTLITPELQVLNLKDGISEKELTTFVLEGTENLFCVTVDDPGYMVSEYQNTYEKITFTDDCSDLTTIIIPDRNFWAYLSETFKFKTDANGNIFQSEANAFSGNMEISDPSIENLEGIKNFVRLENLSINGGGEYLTSVDVSSLENLSSLSISNSSVKTIAFEGCESLQSIDVQNNPLSNLDVSSLPSLQNLTVSNADLTCIQVTDVDKAEKDWRETVDESIEFSLDCKNSEVSHEFSISIQACGQYLFGDEELTSSGDYTKKFTDKEGNDSIVNLSLTISKQLETQMTVVINDGESYKFGNHAITKSTQISATFQSVNGCDSIVYLTVEVTPRTQVFNIVKEIAFGEFEFGGETLTEGGNYRDTVLTEAEEDSIIILVLKIEPTTVIKRNKLIKEGESYDFYGTALTEPGTYKALFPEKIGSDSIVKLTLGYLNDNQTSREINISECDSYMFHGEELTESGSYNYTIEEENVVEILNLTLNNSVEKYLNGFLYAGEEYTLGSETYTKEGNFTQILETKEGCDSTVHLSLELISNDEIVEELSVSACGEYTMDGIKYSSSGLYKSPSYVTEAGKDSSILLNLTINPIYKTVLEDYFFYGNSTTFNNQVLTKTGKYSAFLQSAQGCDSTVELHLNVIPERVVYNLEIAQVCNSYMFYGKEITESGVYKDTVSFNGTDTVHILKLTVGNNYNITRAEYIKEGGTLTFGDESLTEAGTYTKTFSTQTGCDSIVTINLKVVDENAVIKRMRKTVCGEYEFNNNSITESGQYERSFKDGNGNDNIILLDLKVNPTFVDEFSTTINPGEAIIFGNKELTKEGTYTNIFTTTAGCDSTVTLTIEIDKTKPRRQEFNFTACGAYNFNGTYYYQSGTYYDTLKTSYGADSIVKINLTIQSGIDADSVVYIHEGDEFVFGSQTITEAGKYEETFKTLGSCDSTVYLQVYVVPKETTIEKVVATGCGSYSFFGEELTESGTFFHTVNENNTTVHLDLTMVKSFTEDIDEYIYEGETFALGDEQINLPGKYSKTLTSTGGCDSTVNLTLSVVPEGTIVNKIEETACGEFVYDDKVYKESQKLETWSKTENGQDVLTVLYITVNKEYYKHVEATIYRGEIFEYKGTEYSNAGEYILSDQTAKGCDSTTVVTIDFFTYTDTLYVTACGQYDFYGKTLYENGEYKHVKANVSGIDSTIVLNLTIANQQYVTLDTTIYEGEIFVIGNYKMNKTSTFKARLESQNGCDSIVTVNLTVKEGERHADKVLVYEECDSFEYDGKVFTESGNYYFTFKNKEQKDSVVKIELTINNSHNIPLHKNLIEGSTITVGDTAITTPGTYTIHLINEKGCDSTVVLTVERNENTAPYFLIDKGSQVVYVKENKAVGSIIFELLAKDPENDLLTYKIDEENSTFGIDSLTGKVYVKNNEKLDYEKYRTFRLVVIVSDGSLKDKIVLNIFVQNSVGIHNMKEQLSIYPTLINSVLYIDSEITEGEVSVLSASGSLILKTELSEHISLDLHELSKGSYIIKVQTPEGSYFEKVVKE